MKAILLSRVSTPGQDMEAQSKELIKACESEGYSEWILIENKESAIKLSEEDRQGLNDMKARIEQGGVGAVYVWELSRLSRRPEVLYGVREWLQSRRVRLRCLHPDLDMFRDDFSLDVNANIIFGLFVSLCENEMAVKKERFRRAKARNRELGKFSGGGIKYGYSVSEKGFIVPGEKAAAVRDIFGMYIRGMSSGAIYTEMKERGDRLSVSSILAMLRDPVYAGRKNLPAIVDADIFDRVQDMLDGHGARGRTRKHIHLGAGLIRCPECGRGMTVEGREGNMKYRCSRRAAGLVNEVKCGNTAMISKRIADGILWHFARREWQKAMLRDTARERADLRERLKVLQVKIGELGNEQARIEERRERNGNLYIGGEIGEASYRKNKDRIDRDMKALRDRSLRLHREMQEGLERLRTLGDGPVSKSVVWEQVRLTWKTEDPAERREIVRKFIERMTVGYTGDGSRDKTVEVELRSGETVRLTVRAYTGTVEDSGGREIKIP